jgi:hypothetical protein
MSSHWNWLQWNPDRDVEMEGQHDGGVVGNRPSGSSSSAVKEIEVTAKQIVDRISVSGPSGSGGGGVDGIGKLLTGLEQQQSYQNDGGSHTNNHSSNNVGGGGGSMSKKSSIVGQDGGGEMLSGGVNGGDVADQLRKQSLTSRTSRQMSISSVEGQVSAEQRAVEQLLEAVQVIALR